VEDRLSEELLKGTAIAGQHIVFDVEEDEFVIRIQEESKQEITD
jgi:ATP-dependent Clp protease ATP-binding subunit ClpC